MKTTFQYDHYFRYEEMEKCLKQLQESHPDLMDLAVSCVTEEKRKQYVAILTNKDTGDALSKPALYIDGNIHAGEVTSSMCAMHTIDHLLSSYETDKEIRKILDERTVYVIPRVSPDGAELYLSSPYGLRSVNRETKHEAGGICEEDLDEDGVIRMMRIRNDYGAWKKDPQDPSGMLPRGASDDEGEFYDIYPEGVLEEYDGMENLRVTQRKWNLDFNRNFPFGWQPEPRQSGAGKYPLSNTETKAIADFVIAHPNIGIAAIGHTSGGLILYPPGTKASEKAYAYDLTVLKSLAAMGEEELGYKPMNIFDSFLSSKDSYDSGALDDWMYETQGIPSFTVEFWDLATKAGVPVEWGEKKEDPQRKLKRFNACMKWVRENAPQYFSDWKKISHPVFGEVEVGGFNYKFTHQNPPEDFLLKEAEADTRFNLRLLKALPRLSIDEVKTEKIGEGIYRIDAIVGNKGYLSTSLTDTCLNSGKAEPVLVRVETGEVISGKKEEKIPDLQGYSRTETGVFYYGNITTFSNAQARKKLSWIVKAKEGDTIKITASQPKAGTVSIEARI